MKHRNFNTVTIYADFEAYNVTTSETHGNAELITEQLPCGFGYVVCSPFEELSQPSYVYRGSDAAEKFVERLYFEYDRVRDYLTEPQDIEMTEEDEIAFEEADTCYLCRKAFTEGSVKVRDHCHVSSAYRGAAHQVNRMLSICTIF